MVATWGKTAKTATPQAREECVSWVRRTHAKLLPLAGAVSTYGVLPAPLESEEAVHAEHDDGSAFGPNLPRLRAIKKKYDPRNVFRCNLNITPAK